MTQTIASPKSPHDDKPPWLTNPPLPQPSCWDGWTWDERLIAELAVTAYQEQREREEAEQGAMSRLFVLRFLKALWNRL